MPGRSQSWSSIHAQRKEKRVKSRPLLCPTARKHNALKQKDHAVSMRLPDLSLFNAKKCDMSHTRGRTVPGEPQPMVESKLVLGNLDRSR